MDYTYHLEVENIQEMQCNLKKKTLKSLLIGFSTNTQNSAMETYWTKNW